MYKDLSEKFKKDASKRFCRNREVARGFLFKQSEVDRNREVSHMNVIVK